MAAILIKKYGNRRLYDTRDSKYITLDELATKIRGGADVRVIDAQNGEDLTQATLVQLVLESGNAAKFLPVQLLTQMIRLSDDALAEFFSRYVTGALDIYLQTKRNVQSLTAYNPLAQIPVAAGDALARLFMTNLAPAAPSPYAAWPPGAGTAAVPYVAPPPPPVPDEPEVEPPDRNGERASSQSERDAERDGEVAAMRRELDELKQAIREGLSARPAPRKKRRS